MVAPLAHPVFPTSIRLLACASQGAGGDDEVRLRTLLSHFPTRWIAFDRSRKRGSFFECLRQLRTGGFDLFVLEGTGLAAGLAAVFGRMLYHRRFVLSSGDAVAPFLSARLPLGAPLFRLYEQTLYRASSGFIGWTPYLVGRALTMGAPRGVTCPGWAPYTVTPEELRQRRVDIRSHLGIPQDAVVFGIAGALVWSARYQYCYGLELVRAARMASSSAHVLIVGDGSGVHHLKRLAGDSLNRTIFFHGRVAREKIPGYLAAMDVGSLPQTLDGVGSFRYTTKLAEYRAVGLPFLTNQIPMSYDLDQGDIWRLPGETPWSPQFLAAIAQRMRDTTHEFLRSSQQRRSEEAIFCRDQQVDRVTAFLNDLIDSERTG